MTKTAMRCDEFFTVVGYFYVGKFLLKLSFILWKEIKVLLYSHVFPVNLISRYGNWAVVTGSTDGIGKAYAQELARRGLNIFLLSRNPDKLRRVAEEIESEHGVETKTLAVDFSEGKQVYDRIAKALSEVQVGILVNNVGFLSEKADPVYKMSEEDMWTVINLNVGAATLMSKIVLPSMIKAKKGAVVNIGSVAGLYYMPLLSVYSASKAYLNYLSQAMRIECRFAGVTIQTVTPGYVNTNLISSSSFLSRGGLSIPSASKYARHAVATLGVVDKTCGYWVHELQVFLLGLLPPVLVSEGCLYLQKFVYKDTRA